MATTEQRKIQIIADGKKVNASFNEVNASVKLLNNQLKKLPRETDKWTAKKKELEAMRVKQQGIKQEMYGTNKAIGTVTRGTGFLRKGFQLAVKAFLPLFAFQKIAELATGLVDLEAEWTKLKGTIGQTSGLQQDALEKATISTKAIADTFQQDNNAIFGNAKKLVENFGVSYDQAFTIIEKGLVASKDKGGEFLEQIEEYSVQFADAGSSAEDFASQTVKAINEGIYSDKGADVIKEFGLRIREQTGSTRDALENAFGTKFTKELFGNINNGSITTVDALKLVSKQMNDTKIPANQLQTLVADVFGGPGEDAGMKYLRSLENIGGKMDDLIDTTDTYTKKQLLQLDLEKQLAEAQASLTAEFEGSSGVVNNLWMQAKILFFDILGKGIREGRKLMVSLINYFIDLYNESTVMRVAINALKFYFVALFNIIKTNIVNTIEGFKAIGNVIGAVLKGNFRDIPNIVKAASESIKDNFRDMGETLTTEFHNGIKAVVSKEKIALIEVDTDKPVSQSAEAAEKLKREQQKQLADMKKANEDFQKQSLEAERRLEDLKIELIQDAFEKRRKKTDIDHKRALEDLEKRRVEILANEKLTEEQRTLLLAQVDDERKLKADEKKLLDAELEKEEREAKLEKTVEDLSEEEEMRQQKLEELFLTSMQSDFAKEQARLNLQKSFLQKRLAILNAAGLAETLQAQKLRTAVLKIDKQLADGKVENEKRTQQVKKELQEKGLDAARDILSAGLEVLGEETTARKVAATALKAFEIGRVIADGFGEIQGYWSKTGPIPFVGPALATGLSIAAAARTAVAVKRIAATKYAAGGGTGSGKVIGMVWNGSHYVQPSGVPAQWVGSYAQGGHVPGASLGVIGEEGREWVAPNWMIRQPKYANLIGYLESERLRGRAFATGGSTGTAVLPQNSGATADLQQQLTQLENLERIESLLERLNDTVELWPTLLQVVNDPNATAEAIAVQNEIDADSVITRQ